MVRKTISAIYITPVVSGAAQDVIILNQPLDVDEYYEYPDERRELTITCADIQPKDYYRLISEKFDTYLVCVDSIWENPDEGIEYHSPVTYIPYNCITINSSVSGQLDTNSDVINIQLNYKN